MIDLSNLDEPYSRINSFLSVLLFQILMETVVKKEKLHHRGRVVHCLNPL
jgi:hypothetical protein